MTTSAPHERYQNLGAQPGVGDYTKRMDRPFLMRQEEIARQKQQQQLQQAQRQQQDGDGI